MASILSIFSYTGVTHMAVIPSSMQVIQFIYYAIECAAMYAVIGWINGTFVAAKETVRHDEINNIILAYLPVHSLQQV